MAATLDDVLTAIVARVTALALEVASTSVTVVRRKYPKAEEGLDTLPMVCVACSGDPESSVPFATGKGDGAHLVRVHYRIWVVLVTAGNADAISNEADLLTARQGLRKAFEVKGADLPAGGIRVLPEAKTPPLDARAWPSNYDAFALSALVQMIETAGN